GAGGAGAGRGGGGGGHASKGTRGDPAQGGQRPKILPDRAADKRPVQSRHDPFRIDGVLTGVRCKDAAKHGNSERSTDHSRRVHDASSRTRVRLRRSRQAGVRHTRRRSRRSDAGRRGFPVQAWRRSFARARQAPSLLPPVCGLDRTTTAYRGRSWCGLGKPVLRTEMDRTGARQSRPHHYASRPPRADGSLRAFNLTAARLPPHAGVSFNQPVAEADVLRPSPLLKDLVQGVRSIASIWTHLAWPATGLPRLCPFGTDKDVRTIYFIYGTVTRALVDADAALRVDRQSGLDRGDRHRAVWQCILRGNEGRAGESHAPLCPGTGAAHATPSPPLPPH